jgi:hypothetical protein
MTKNVPRKSNTNEDQTNKWQTQKVLSMLLVLSNAYGNSMLYPKTGHKGSDGKEKLLC